MITRYALLLAAALVDGQVNAGAPPPAPAVPDEPELSACAALRALDFSEATGAAVTLRDVSSLPAERDLPDLCRVAGTIAPKVGFDLRMPVRTWNGKLLVSGCTNLCGVLQTAAMEDALSRGYAAVTTDMGHSEAEYPGSSWAYNNLPLETDFGHRATHVTTLAAREIVASYYGNGPEYAYYRGCSTGGRQGLVAAARYPDDFDGIIAGAPFNQALSVPHMAWVYAANTGADGQPILKYREFELLGKAAIAACDGLDGLQDGVIGDPERCPFTPAALRCADPQAGGAKAAKPQRDCLTPAQADAATKIYAGARNSRGEKLYPAGAPVGSEFTWAGSLIAPPGKPAFFYYILQNWSQYLAYEPDPPLGSGPFVFDFDNGPAKLRFTNELTGYTPDLDRFESLGGRLLLYHGWVDESLMPSHTLAYWRQAGMAQGAAEGGPAQLAGFARLFMVPGMLHCGGGPGATDIDYLTALEHWVENGEAPEVLIAARTRDSVPTFVRQPRFPLSPAAVLYTRPVYPYPDVAIYDGAGDPKSAASFRRTRPKPAVGAQPAD